MYSSCRRTDRGASTGVRRTSTATARTVRPGPPSTTPKPHLVRPGSTPNTRTTAPRIANEQQFEPYRVHGRVLSIDTVRQVQVGVTTVVGFRSRGGAVKRFWVVVGCVGTFMAVAILIALAVPREVGVAIDKVVQLLFAVAALVAYARQRNGWMTAAMATLTIGLSAWIWGQQILGVQLPTSTIAPLGFTLVPVLCLAAVVVKAQQRRADDLLPNSRSRAVVVLDGLIVIGSLFVLTWVSALESLTRAWATEGPGFATVVAHPAAYLVLLVAIVVMSWTHQSVRQWPMLFVALAGVAQSSSGWVFAFYISKGITAIPATADIGFMLCPAFFFLSALAPVRNLEPTPGRMRMA